jgi:hypothetical protein
MNPSVAETALQFSSRISLNNIPQLPHHLNDKVRFDLLNPTGS